VSKKKPVVKQAAPKKAVVPPQKPQRDYTLAFLLVIIAIVSFIRYRYIKMPLERDEGEYAYIGNLFLHGITPFKDGYSMKLPGTSFMYAVFMLLFGHTNRAIHWGLLLMNASTMCLLYYAFKKMFNSFLAIATAAIYGAMAVGLPFIGLAAHATHFICFYSAIALLLLSNFLKSGKLFTLFLIGLMMGMAFLMKQQAAFMVLFFAVFLVIYLKMEKKLAFPEIARKFLFFGSGVAIPYIIVFLIIVCTGRFYDFWLWTVKYASQYEAVKSWYAISTCFKESFIPAWMMYNYLWIIALLGLLVLYWTPYTRMQKLFVLGYFVASVCTLSSGFYFRQHYYIVILPAVGLLSGILIDFLIKQARKRIPVLKSLNGSLIVLSVLVFTIIYTWRGYYFSYTVEEVCDMSYWGNPFNEASKIAKYIKENTSDTDKIAVLGSEPEIYFYADRIAATGYLYTYPLVDNQPYNEIMQQQMIQEIEKNAPPFLVFCNVPYSWLAKKDCPTTIINWINSYTSAHYTPVCFVDFSNDTGWSFYWGNGSKNPIPQTVSYIIIYKRKPDKVLSYLTKP